MVHLREQGRTATTERLAKTVREHSYPLDDDGDLDVLLEEVGDARLVLLGEASHGTSQYYTWRARISQRLIREKGFSFVAVESDWPDSYQINRFVKHCKGAANTSREVLQNFTRWPTWMWANWEVAAFIEWLRKHNADREDGQQAGFFGLDVYSLWESMESILEYLQKNDPEAARLAHKAYLCFESYGKDVQDYAWSTRMVPDTCEEEVIELLMKLRRTTELFERDPDGAFNVEQNALVMVNAEKYYRAMVRSDSNSWNVRDTHMMDTLDRLLEHHGAEAKGIVWAHNTHVGDARYTDMAEAGMVNIGQLARQRHTEAQVVLVGFASYRGSVIAGDQWGAPMERMSVPAAQPGTWEDIFHTAKADNQLLRLKQVRQDPDFGEVRGHRTIGVVYDPKFEHYGNYVSTILPFRYDAFLYLDKTEALHPLHLEPEGARVPETYPWGL